jgi:hypothetical protein
MPEPLSERSWGVLVYIIGDHQGLSKEEADDIDKVATEEALKLVRAARGLDDVYVSVHVDLTHEKGSSVYRVPEKVAGDRKPERRPEDRASLANLVEFIETEKAARPTKHKLVILWGHSGGPIGLFQDPDGGPGTGTLRLSELGKILPAFRTKPQAPIDILLVKSCYLASLEAAWEVERIVDFMICSQARVPLRTWTIWEEVFEQINKDKEPQALAHDILAALDRHYSDVVERNDRDEIPFSLLKPAGVTAVKPPLTKLLEFLLAHRNDPRILQAIEDARPSNSGDKALVDLRNLCVNLMNVGDERLTLLAAALDSTLADGLIVKTTPETSRFNGVGVFHFPRDPLLRTESFANIVTEAVYADLSFAKAVPWSRLAFATPDDPYASPPLMVSEPLGT